jgi:hypothetical protein
MIRSVAESGELETDLLLAASLAHPDGRRLDRIRELTCRDLDWDRLIDAARFHGTLPLLWWNLSWAGPERVPADRAAFLQDQFRANAGRGLLMQRELLRVLHLLGERGIVAVPYKGPVLATTLYGNVALRTYGDLDIVVRPGDQARALDALLADRYRRIEVEEEELGQRQRWHHELVRDDGAPMLELHWSFAQRSWRFLPDLDGVWARLQPWPVGHEEVDGFCPEDLLAVLCVHGARHFWLRLLWICDIAQLVESCPQTDWTRVVRDARRSGTLRLVLLGLALAEELLGTELAAPVRDALRSEPEVRSVAAKLRARTLSRHPVEPKGREATDLYLEMRERWRERAAHVLEPNFDDLRTVSLPPALSGVYWVVRPLKLAARYTVGPPLRKARAVLRSR